MKRSTRDWSPQRVEAHYKAFPPEQKDERNRQAQADYRARNRKRIAAANKIRAIVVRQTWNYGDEQKIADAFKLLLSPESVAEVVKALTAPMAAGGKTKATKASTKAPLVWRDQGGHVYSAEVPGGGSYDILYHEAEPGFADHPEMAVNITPPDGDDMESIETFRVKKFSASHLAKAKAIAEKHWQAQMETPPAPTTKTAVELPITLTWRRDDKDLWTTPDRGSYVEAFRVDFAEVPNDVLRYLPYGALYAIAGLRDQHRATAVTVTLLRRGTALG
jgi:hypothetical protein